MRIVFMGTPEFAIPSLKALIANHQVTGVFCQPDKPVGRHQNKLQPPPVKVCAQEHGIPVFQPEKLRNGTALAVLKELDPELIVVAAYGRILPDEILALPPKGCVNIHSSLLPKYRGAAPINWAILNGEQETGVTIMHMASQLDAGDIILQQSTPIDPAETAAVLYDRLAELGGKMILEAAAQIEAGASARIPQDHEKATLAPMLSKALSPIDWSQSAQSIYNKARGLVPWPMASTDVISGEPMKIYSAQVVEKHLHDAAPGCVVSTAFGGIDIACGDGNVLRILELQPPGKKKMTAAAYLRGHPLQV
ncbi:MAG: methionyl-tRNA formyltransferase [Lawsonibacter sp.]|nr:methionyl-tRNA formyltransferase [Lawsonibacter sp.]